MVGAATAIFGEVTYHSYLDNGPHNFSYRTQFLKRMIEFADWAGLEIRLVYYPPYHSKYNPIERCWGHWKRMARSPIDVFECRAAMGSPNDLVRKTPHGHISGRRLSGPGSCSTQGNGTVRGSPRTFLDPTKVRYYYQAQVTRSG